FEIYKPPVSDVSWFQAKVIAHGRRNIEAGAFVQVWLWPFVSENVLPVIGAERSCVFPLRVCDAVAFTDGDPVVFTGGNRRALICFAEPGNNSRRFGPMTLPPFVVVRERAIKRIEFWREVYGDIIAATSRIRLVHAAVVFGPLIVP